MRDNVNKSALNQLNTRQVLSMFEMMPDVLFWIKDAEGKIIHANHAFIEHVGLNTLDQAIGKTDWDFAPAHIAKQFIVDDNHVMQGDVINDRLELNITPTGNVAWFSTSKKPLIDNDGHIIGSFGVTRHLNKSVKALSEVNMLKETVDYVMTNFDKPLTLAELAEVAHLSVSALERRFKKYLSKTPKQFIREVRLEHARRLLIETQLPIAEVAYRAGYTDHSYFSSHFKQLFEVLPSSFRNQATLTNNK